MGAQQSDKAVDAEQSEAELLAQILRDEQLVPLFQPIVDLRTGECLGYEALIRGPRNTPLHTPAQLFGAAARQQLLPALERLCRRCSLQQFTRLGLGGKLFLNVSISLRCQSDQPQGLGAELSLPAGFAEERLVIEFSEQQPFDLQGASQQAVEHCRAQGFAIAIDDLGAGYSGLKRWAQMHPDYVKIDMHFVRGIDQDAVKREFVRAICNIGHSLRCKIIAEGIETTEELQALQELGVRYGQGFLLGRPEAKPAPQFDPQVLRGMAAGGRVWRRSGSETAQVLARPVPSVTPDDRLYEVSEIFSQQPQLGSVPVLVDGEPVGIVRRDELRELFATQFGRALYEQKPVARLLSRQVLIVDSNTPLEQVSQLITEQDEGPALQQELLITLEGCYLGMGSVRDLLKRITEQKIRNARYSNPLTLLPGSVAINREIDLLLQKAADFHVAHFDLRGFKHFNKRYGYTQGDQLLRQIGALLTRHVDPAQNFVGHVGADDFIVLFCSGDWQQRCHRLLSDFAVQRQGFYTAQHLQAGGFWSQDATGAECFQPLLSLTVGVAYPDPYKCSSHHEVTELALAASRAAQREPDGTLFESQERYLRQPWREASTRR